MLSSQIFKNINSVAFYESKLLGRGWFFRIFSIILLALGLSVTLSSGNLFDQSEYFPNIYAYAVCLYLNVCQSIIIIFLSADYLKRDKQLDTSEVFYVRPLSNAEYLFGKMWGTLMRFIILDVILMVVFFVIGRFVSHIAVSPLDFITYFILIIIPSMIFTIGVSTAVMLLIGNQAITFVVMLGASALSIFYVGDLFYNLFDIFAYSIPLYKSKIIGFTNLDYIIPHRLIYYTMGMAAIFISIYRFKRLAGSKKSQYKWFVMSMVLFGISAFWGVSYFAKATGVSFERREMMALNDQYITYPKLFVENYELDVEHLGESIASKVKAKGSMSADGDKLVFSLNSYMKLESVMLDDSPVDFERENHLIIVTLPKEYAKDDQLTVSFVYEGTINHNELFIDIQGDMLAVKNQTSGVTLNIDKKGALIEKDWVVLIPESYW
ncbi:MAG: hypothetical protein R3Y04_06050, partial [Rikenellaceae bacterium]